MIDVCSHERLERALAGLLSTDDDSTLHLHLETCAECSAELERLAGGERASREVVSMLAPDDLDDALPPRELCSTADFVVEHLEPSEDPTVLARLGTYDVLEIIGRGGMGVVLKGFDRELKRFVAIKTLAPHLAHSALARKRFAREAQAAAAVVNPHVIAIHQVQPNGRLPFLVMPLLSGETLAQRMTVRGTLELTEILRIGMQAAEGLAAAHGQGLVHRDIKPANILLEKGVERAVVTDFGLARAADDVSVTRWGIIAGTPEYMSPEQARGEILDGRSDLFSLGCVLYEMATGVSPFRTDSTIATLRRIVDETPAAMASLAPDLPPWFIAIVERLLAKEPAQRFASAIDVRNLMEQCLSHLQQPASVPLPMTTAAAPAPDVRRSARPLRTLWFIGAALAGSLILAGVLIVLELNKATRTVGPALDGAADGTVVQGGAVSLRHGAQETVRILGQPAPAPVDSRFPGMTAEIADAILDWTDGDEERRPFGAEAETYLQLKSPHSPSNRPLTGMEELLLIRGVTPQLIYGADTNRNGIIDGGEAGEGVVALGWAGLIRAHRSESAASDETVPSEVDRVLFALDPGNARVDRFAELDTDNDGRLSLAEFGVGRKPKSAAKWFGLRDVDQDDFLSPAEFVPLSAVSVAENQAAEPTGTPSIARTPGWS
jgi:serine/threonine-protein kinase